MLNEKQIQRMLAKVKRFEQVLNNKLFEVVDKVDMAFYQTDNPQHTIPDIASFKSCRPGMIWGEEGAYGWFRGQYTVPERLAGQTLFLYPDIGGYEALLWVDDVPAGIFCSKIVEHSHGNHYCNRIAENPGSGTIINLALEYYAGHHVRGCMPFEDSGITQFDLAYKGVSVCVKNEAIASFYFDLKTLNQLAASLDSSSFVRAAVINTLTDIHECLFYSPEQVDHDLFMNAVFQAAGLASDILNKLEVGDTPMTPKAGLIGHSHMDTAWLWPIDETIKKCARTFSNQMNLMRQYPEYTFIQSSACHSDMMRQHYPALFEQIQKQVQAGRYEPNGGVWVECDCNIPSGESVARQFIWGQRFTRKYFDFTSDAFWLPDTFGYSPALPQIMRGAGIKYFLTTKIAWNDTTEFPYESFYWQGIDGSQVLTHFNKTHIWPDPQNVLRYVVEDRQSNDAIKEKTVNQNRLLSYGFGDGGGGPQFEMIEMARRMKNIAELPATSHTTVSQFMQKLEEQLVRPSYYRGELYLELHRGTLTSLHQIKRNNRLLEIALHHLEWMTVLDQMKRQKSFDGKSINPLMHVLLINQFHDILPGTSITRVHQESIAATSEALVQATAALNKLGESLTENDETYLTLFNSLSFRRQDVFYINLPKNKKLTADVLQQRVTDFDGQSCLAVSGLTLDPLSAASFAISEAENCDSKAGLESPLSPFIYSEQDMLTPFYKVEWDKEGGIRSLVDRRNMRELRGEGYPLNTFLIAEDVPAQWDNWDIDADLELKFKDQAKLISREIVSEGAVEIRIRSQYQLTRKSSLTQDMIFYAGQPEIRFVTKINWQDHHRFLKTAFDTSIQSEFSRHEVQFGSIKRPTTRNTAEEEAKFEVSNHKYTDLSETRYGIALLNDCKYGLSVKGGQMRLSLHKGGLRPDDTGDTGIHDCTYSFYPHDTGFKAETVIQPAYALNVHPVQISGKGDIPSLIQADAPNIVIETVKPCEDSDSAYIIRLYEAEGTYTPVRLTFGHSFTSLSETNLLEEELLTLPAEGQVAALAFKPFEIKTIKVKL